MGKPVMLRTFASNALTNLIGVAVLAIVTLATTPILIEGMGDVAFGLYRIALVSVVSFAFLLDLGLSGAVKRTLGDAINRGDLQCAQHALAMATLLYSGVALFALALVSSMALWLPQFINVGSSHFVAFKLILVAAGVYIAFVFLQSILNAIFIIYGRFDYLQLTTVGSKVVQIILTVVLIEFIGLPLEMAALSAVVVSLVTLLVSLWLVKRLWPSVEFGVKNWRAGNIRDFTSLSGYGLLIALGPVTVYYAQDIVIAKGLGVEYLAAYAAATILATQVRVLLNSVSSPLFTIASRHSASGSKEDVALLLRESVSRGMFFWVIVIVPLMMCSKDIILLWIGERFVDSSLIFDIQAIGTFGIALYLAAHHILNALGILRWTAIHSIIMAVLSLILCVVLIRFTSLELIGIALGVSVPILIRGFAVVYCAAGEVGLSRIGLFKLIFFRGAPFFLVSMMVMRFALGEFVIASYLGLAVKGGIAFIGSAILGFFFYLERSERASLFTLLRKKFV